MNPRGSRPATAVLWLAFVVLNIGANLADARRTGPHRTQAIDMVVIHSTGGPTCDAQTRKRVWVPAGTLDEDIRNIEAHPKLGIHYMIDRDGSLRRSVPEDQLAHHAVGYSGRSIAIELINDGDGLDPFPEHQLSVLVDLLRDITRRRGITRDGIKRHSDVDIRPAWCDKTQRRKLDPGAAFPYEQILDRVFQRDPPRA